MPGDSAPTLGEQLVVPTVMDIGGASILIPLPWHLGTVLPVARVLPAELTAQLETEIRLRFDSYPLDLS